jgi:transposase
MSFENLSAEELRSKKEWYAANGWDTNLEAAREELSSRQEEDLSEAQLSGSSTAEEKAETLYQYLQEAGEYADEGDKDTYWEMLEDVNHTLEQESAEVNQIYSQKVNSDWD